MPCSVFYDMWDIDIPSTCEEEAMALAAGAILAGKKPEVFIQNSGLGDIVNIVTSLYKPYGIPLPRLHVSNRTTPKQHEFMGGITMRLLSLLEYEGVVFYA